MRTLDRYIGRTFLAACLLILAVLAVLGAELDIVVQGHAGNLDELRRERAQTPAPRAASAADAPSTFNKTGSR